MSFIKEGAGRANRWLQGRFDPNRASEEAGIKFIVKLGMLADRITAISEMNFDETIASEVDAFINWSSQTWESAIPYLQAKDDNRMLTKVLAYLKQHSMFLRIRAKLEKNKETRDMILEEIAYSPASYDNVDLEVAEDIKELFDDGEDGEEELEPMTQQEQLRRELKINFLIAKLPQDLQIQLNRYTVDSLEQKISQCRFDMLRYSKLLIALSFGKTDVEPAPPIVFSKQEVTPRMQAPPQVRDSRELNQLQQNVQTLEYYVSRNKREGN